MIKKIGFCEDCKTDKTLEVIKTEIATIIVKGCACLAEAEISLKKTQT